jgi:acyl-CoA hydrolase
LVLFVKRFKTLQFLTAHHLLLEYELNNPDDIVEKIGKYVSRIIKDGDTLQIRYGSIPNAILAHLTDKSDFRIHTELLTEGVVNLMRLNVVNNKGAKQR